uniref:Prospero domain-containing protein n=1 Tax=Periophthalmus magnuspinnatus TaxID=409849 RepID=A0A3B4AWW7_9GOBI
THTGSVIASFTGDCAAFSRDSGSDLFLEGCTAEQVSSFQLASSGDVPDLYYSQSEESSNVMHLPLQTLGREAKRARVESIIKSMNGSEANPQEIIPEGTNKNTTLYPYQMEMFKMHQHQNQYQRCKQVQIKNEDTMVKNLYASPKLPQNTCMDIPHGVQQANHSQQNAERIKYMTDILKCELSKALSTSVDTIFKAQTKQERKKPPLYHQYYDSSPSYTQMTPVPLPAFQTEALSLVVRKDKSVPISQYCTGDQELTPTKKSSKSLQKRDFEREQRKITDKSWYVLKERSKEGLTTNHLKKAKLMFFYTRYPSSHVLKMCFSDVQFTRCITSQLIKWFSNFREFFYIQMEKFARHAVLQRVTDAEALTVGRESELFRVLNLHYNKTSDFQVPDRFLEVAEITLREFYVAICLGKDQDPAWKKAIYRVISKLDSDVPTHFILT